MPSWNDLIEEIKQEEAKKQAEIQAIKQHQVLDAIRQRYIGELAKIRDRNVVCYYSGWLQRETGVPVGIDDDDMNGFMNVIHGLDRSKGLDLVLHTPGGDLAATEAIVKYIRSCFGNDIVAIVPQLAMSAGTMIACSCKSIVMGRQSSLGPTDPQINGVAAGGVIEEFENAIAEVEGKPSSAALWAQIIGKYHPTFLGDCQKALDASREIVGGWLSSNMFSERDDAEQMAERVVSTLCDHSKSAMHARHFSFEDLENLGIVVERLESDDKVQDAVLTMHHAFMNTFAMSRAFKIIENNNGKRWVKQVSD